MSRPLALAVAAVHVAGDGALELLARIAGPDAVEARAEAVRLLASPRELAAATERLRAPQPAHLDEIHPEWRAQRIALGDAAAPEVRVWADRLAYAGLVDMPAPGEVRSAADLPRARADWLALRLERLGLRQLAHATAGASKVELAALAARLERRGKAYIEAVTRIRELGDGAASLHGPRRAAQARCDGIRVAHDPMAFLAIGARAVAPHIAAAGGDTARQLAQRLPREPGLRVLEELTSWGRSPLDDAPAWSEVM
jgi:hypothetical protein